MASALRIKCPTLRKAGHLQAIKVEIHHKNNIINVLSFHKLKFWMEIGGGMASKNLDKEKNKKTRT